MNPSLSGSAAMKKLLLTVLLATGTLLGGCATTKTTGNWLVPQTESQKHPSFKKLYVLTLMPQDAVAVELEEALLKELDYAGVEVISGRSQISADVLRDPAQRAAIVEKVKATDADGVLVVLYLRADERQNYIPPTTTYMPSGGAYMGGPYYGGYGGYVGYHYDLVYQPGYYVTSREYYLQSSLYQARDEKLLWRAQSATSNPNSVQDGVKSFSKSLVKELRRDKALD